MAPTRNMVCSAALVLASCSSLVVLITPSASRLESTVFGPSSSSLTISNSSKTAWRNKSTIEIDQRNRVPDLIQMKFPIRAGRIRRSAPVKKYIIQIFVDGDRHSSKGWGWKSHTGGNGWPPEPEGYVYKRPTSASRSRPIRFDDGDEVEMEILPGGFTPPTDLYPPRPPATYLPPTTTTTTTTTEATTITTTTTTTEITPSTDEVEQEILPGGQTEATSTTPEDETDIQPGGQTEGTTDTPQVSYGPPSQGYGPPSYTKYEPLGWDDYSDGSDTHFQDFDYYDETDEGGGPTADSFGSGGIDGSDSSWDYAGPSAWYKSRSPYRHLNSYRNSYSRRRPFSSSKHYNYNPHSSFRNSYMNSVPHLQANSFTDYSYQF